MALFSREIDAVLRTTFLNPCTHASERNQFMVKHLLVGAAAVLTFAAFFPGDLNARGFGGAHGGGRQGGNREGGNREGRSGGNREGGNREGGNREGGSSGNRSGGNREGGN